jgi:hypothetical protein
LASLTHGDMVLNAARDNNVSDLRLRVDVLPTEVQQAVHDKNERKKQRLTFSKFGFTKVNHCLMMPSISRPRSLWSRNTASKLESPTVSRDNGPQDKLTPPRETSVCICLAENLENLRVSLGKPHTQASQGSPSCPSTRRLWGHTRQRCLRG